MKAICNNCAHARFKRYDAYCGQCLRNCCRTTRNAVCSLFTDKVVQVTERVTKTPHIALFFVLSAVNILYALTLFENCTL